MTEIRDRLGRDNNHQTVYKRVDEIEIKLQSINDKLDRLIAQLGYDGRDVSVFEQLDSIGNMIRR